MPRYRYDSHFERVLFGLSVGVAGVSVFPADGRPDPAPGSTVVLDFGDEIDSPTELTRPGLVRVDTPPAPPPAPAAPVTAPTAPAPTPAEEPQP